MMPFSTLKLIGIGLGVLAFIALLAMVNGWRVERDHLRAQVTAACDATREASANPKLDCKAMPQQIRLLGKAVLDLKFAIIDQNTAIGEMAAESERQRRNAVQAAEKARQRANGAEDAANRLIASASDPARQKQPCEPSAALKGAWK
jgi:ABC-type lipoprotein release transport system permease subunit